MASWSVARGVRLRELEKLSSLSGVMPGLSFELDPNEMKELCARFAAFPGAIRAASLEAAEKTRRAARNELVRSYRKLLTLKPAYIGRGIKSKKARMTGNGAEAEIRIATRSIPLIRYDVNPENPPHLKGVPIKSRRRVSYALRLGGKTYDDTPRDGAPADAGKLFTQRMRSGHIGVFYRLKSGGMQEQYAPSLQYHAYADGFMDHIEDFVRQKLKAAFLEDAAKISGMGSAQ